MDFVRPIGRRVNDVFVPSRTSTADPSSAPSGPPSPASGSPSMARRSGTGTGGGRGGPPAANGQRRPPPDRRRARRRPGQAAGPNTGARPLAQTHHDHRDGRPTRRRARRRRRPRPPPRGATGRTTRRQPPDRLTYPTARGAGFDGTGAGAGFDARLNRSRRASTSPTSPSRYADCTARGSRLASLSSSPTDGAPTPSAACLSRSAVFVSTSTDDLLSLAMIHPHAPQTPTVPDQDRQNAPIRPPETPPEWRIGGP